MQFHRREAGNSTLILELSGFIGAIKLSRLWASTMRDLYELKNFENYMDPGS